MILTVSAALLGAMQTAPVRIEAKWDGETCSAIVEGRVLSDEELDREARLWVRERRSVSIAASVDTPYRCVGVMIFRLQRDGLDRINFLSEPTTVRLTVLPGTCRLAVAGDITTLGELARLFAQWERSGTLVALQLASPEEAKCAQPVLDLWGRYPDLKMGFTGNEVADQEDEE